MRSKDIIITNYVAVIETVPFCAYVAEKWMCVKPVLQSTNGKKKGQKGNVKRKNSKNKSAVRRNNKRTGLPNNGCDLNSKIFATMDKHKEVSDLNRK